MFEIKHVLWPVNKILASRSCITRSQILSDVTRQGLSYELGIPKNNSLLDMAACSNDFYIFTSKIMEN